MAKDKNNNQINQYNEESYYDDQITKKVSLLDIDKKRKLNSLIDYWLFNEKQN